MVDEDCTTRANLRPGDVVWPECFDDPSKASAVRKRLRQAGLDAQVLRISRYERAVRYRPLSAAEASAQGRDARSRRGDAEQQMLEVSVDWDPELRSFRYELDASCPSGWVDVGDRFLVTSYVLVREEEMDEEAELEETCGVDGAFREGFLYGSGVKLQGSGMSLDGRIIHWAGDGCFEELDCPRTALGTCARSSRTVAVDPEVIPLGTEVLIEGVGIRRAEDTGGRIRGAHIDVYYGTDLSVARANARTGFDRLVCVRDTDGSID